MDLNEIKDFDKFDKLNDITTQEYERLRAIAKAYVNRYCMAIDFEAESCFISTQAIDGFYFPNAKRLFCIAFENGKPVDIYKY